MKTLSRIQLIGDIQVYVKPHLSLYYDYKEKKYALFLRLNSFSEKVEQYIFFYVEKNDVIEFMNKSIGFRELSVQKKIYSTKKKKNGVFIDISEYTSVNELKEFEINEMFDSEYCLDYCEIIWTLKN